MNIEYPSPKNSKVSKPKADSSIPKMVDTPNPASNAIPTQPIPSIMPNIPLVARTGQMKIKRSIFWVIVVVAIVSLYGCFHFYSKYRSLTADPNAEAEKVTAELVGVLGKLMELPKDEIPTVATISDKDKLAGQVFFKNAENGDILFAYTNAMKAILYRPTTNKIINVAPISINQDQSIDSGAKQGLLQASPRDQAGKTEE